MDPTICPECGDWFHTCPCPAPEAFKVEEKFDVVNRCTRCNHTKPHNYEIRSGDRDIPITVCRHPGCVCRTYVPDVGPIADDPAPPKEKFDKPRGITVCRHHVRADEYCASCAFDDAMAAKDRREGKNPGREQVSYQRPKLGDWLIVIEPSPLKYTVLPVATKEQAVALVQSMKPESNPAIYRREDIRITRGISMSAKVIGEGVDDA